MGLNVKEKQAVTREYTPRYQKATKKEKRALLDEFTRLTGYHRKSAIRLLSARPVREVLAVVDRKTVKLKLGKKRLDNLKGKRFYTDGAIASWTYPQEVDRKISVKYNRTSPSPAHENRIQTREQD
jgi:hypothetical protein